MRDFSLDPEELQQNQVPPQIGRISDCPNSALPTGEGHSFQQAADGTQQDNPGPAKRHDEMEQMCRLSLCCGAMYVCPCPDELKRHLCFSYAARSRGRVLRQSIPQWVTLDDADGIGCPRSLFHKTSRFLRDNGIPFLVETGHEILPPLVTRDILSGISDRDFLAIQRLMENLDSGGGVVLHSETGDISGIIASLIRLFSDRRIVVCTKDKNEQEEITQRVNHFLDTPNDELRPLDFSSGTVPGHAVIYQGDICLPEPDEVDVFIMLHVDLLSGLKLYNKAQRYFRSLKFGFASKTGNSYQNKIPFMEGVIGPVLCDLRDNREEKLFAKSNPLD